MSSDLNKIVELHSTFSENQNTLNSVTFVKIILDACILHLESKKNKNWQINYHGGWEAATEELKKLLNTLSCK